MDSRQIIERQKIRTLQIVFLMVGLVLIIYGVTRVSTRGVTTPFEQLWQGKIPEAVTGFEQDIKKHPERVESRIGLVLAYLQQEKGLEAEEVWSWLMQAPEAKSLTDTTRLGEWQAKNFRRSLSLRGEVAMTQAWLTGERLARAYRREDPEETISRLERDHQTFMSAFAAWVEERESLDEKNPLGSGASVWRKRYLDLETKMREAPRIGAVVAATALMRQHSRNPRDESDEVVTAMYERHLRRAVREAPEALAARCWEMLVLVELVRRKLPLQDQGDPETALREALQGVTPYMSKIEQARPPLRARLHCAVAMAFRLLAARDADQAETYRTAADSQHALGVAAIAMLADNSEELPSLRALAADAAGP